MNVVAFAASSSTQSINKKLVTYAASLLPAHNVEILDLNDFELPLFSVDREQDRPILRCWKILRHYRFRLSLQRTVLICSCPETLCSRRCRCQ